MGRNGRTGSWRMVQRVLVSGLALVVCGACSMLPYHPKVLFPSKRRAEVRVLAESFAANLRFQRYDFAAGLVEEEQRIEFMRLLSDPRSELRFTDYQVITVQLGPGMTEAQAFVTFRLHRLPSMNEVVFQDEQTWSYDTWNNTWYLVPDLEGWREAGKPVDVSGRTRPTPATP